MARVELPDGAWAELRDPKTVTEGQRRPVMRASGALAAAAAEAKRAGAEDDAAFVTAAALEAMESMNDALVVALVAAWSFAAAPSLDALLDLPGAVYDALRNACAPLLTELLPDFGVSPDPASPTEPSAA